MDINSITSKRRVELALSFKEPDRPPIRFEATPEFETLLKSHFNGEDILEVLHVDFRRISPESTCDPLEPEPLNGIDFYDEWGVGYKNVRLASGTSSQVSYRPYEQISSPSDIDKVVWPDPNNYDYSRLKSEAEKYQDYSVVIGYPDIPDIINGTSRGLGMEKVLIGIMTGEDIVLALIERRLEILYEYLTRCLEAVDGLCDIVWLGDDFGMQTGLLFPLRIFEEFFRPRLQRFIDLAHNYGCKVMFHSCGSTRKLIPNFIDMGIDILDSVQTEAEGMEPKALKKDFGDKIVFCGMIDLQGILLNGTTEQCRNMARHRVEVIGRGGGYIFGPSWTILPETPIENVLAVYEEAIGETL